jgi:organic hydroperoxide reductase OsmC/OhrA
MRRASLDACPIALGVARRAGRAIASRPPARYEARMATHHFEAQVSWRAGGEGVTASTHRVQFAGRPPLEIAPAPQYRGDPSRLNPEELFVAALTSCQLLTYLALAPRAGITVLAYEDRPLGTLAVADKKMRMTDVLLRPRITVAPGTDEAKALALVESAHEACFIANSVACPVRLEPEIVVDGS